MRAVEKLRAPASEHSSIRAKAKFCEHFQIGWGHSILLAEGMEIENLARAEACMLMRSKVKCCSNSFNIYSRGSVKKWHENRKLLAKNAEARPFQL